MYISENICTIQKDVFNEDPQSYHIIDMTDKQDRRKREGKEDKDEMEEEEYRDTCRVFISINGIVQFAARL